MSPGAVTGAPEGSFDRPLEPLQQEDHSGARERRHAGKPAGLAEVSRMVVGETEHVEAGIDEVVDIARRGAKPVTGIRVRAFLARQSALEQHAFELVIYDECHHAAADDNMRVLRQLGAFEPDWPGTLLGFTATTIRGDGKGLDEVFGGRS